MRPPKPAWPAARAGILPFSPAMIPLFPSPEESRTLVPLVSLNRHSPTRALGPEHGKCRRRVGCAAQGVADHHRISPRLVQLQIGQYQRRVRRRRIADAGELGWSVKIPLILERCLAGHADTESDVAPCNSVWLCGWLTKLGGPPMKEEKSPDITVSIWDCVKAPSNTATSSSIPFQLAVAG